MGRVARSRTKHGCEALLVDGPLAGAHVQVTLLPDGDPVGVLPIRGNRRGTYVCAGFTGPDGLLPYRWVRKGECAGLRGWLRFSRDAS